MASTKPVPARAAARTGTKGKPAPPVKRGPRARVVAASADAREPLAAAKGMAGWRAAKLLLGEALAAAATGVVFEAAGSGVTQRRRVDGAWQPPQLVSGDDARDAFAALKKLAVPGAAGQDETEFTVSARKISRRSCRAAARAADKREQVVVLIGPELPPPQRPKLGRWIVSGLGRLVPPFLKRKPPPLERDPTLPLVELEATGPDAAARRSAAVEATGYWPACDLVAAAVRERASTVAFEAGPQGVAVRFDVDGVVGPVPRLEPPLPLDKAGVAAVVGVLKNLAGLDPQGRGRQQGAVTAMVGEKPWPCTVVGLRGAAGERLEVFIEHARPRFKSLADTGMSEDVVGRLGDFLKLDGGLILVAAPRRGGLSTLFDGIVSSCDRLLRDFVLLEDATRARPEIQNVKPFRWDPRKGEKPTAALEAAVREYPNVIATCDLEDAELARRLVAQAEEGRLVILGIRGDDAADGLARLAALGVDRELLARVLHGAVGARLVRKLCPKCRREYVPLVETLVRLGRDPDVDLTLFRAARAGCPVCTGTGYLGRTAACELAAGPTLRAHLAKAVDAGGLRKAAGEDGMRTIPQDAIAKAARGVTSVEEIQRAFRKA